MGGADGISYPPEVIASQESIWIFNDQLSRSIWLDFIQEADVDGATTYQYSPKPNVFAMTNPDNFCYCPKVEQCAKVNETAEDAWDISDCQDKTLKFEACIDGLLDPTKNITFLNIEPNTGMSLQAHKRIQVSVPVAKSKYFQDLQNLDDPANRTIWPVVWVDEGADATEENLDLIKSMLVTPFLVVDIGTYVLIGIGGALLILAASLHFFCKPS